MHLAITYAEDGTVTAYRDGVPYGSAYKSAGPAVFKAGDSEILLGCRHGSPGGNRQLTGRILRARLHTRALSAAEVRDSSRLEKGVVQEREVLAALEPARREKALDLQQSLAAKIAETKTLRGQIEALGGKDHSWASLALSLINAKEFVYLK